jgi:hypothetical protein
MVALNGCKIQEKIQEKIQSIKSQIDCLSAVLCRGRKCTASLIRDIHFSLLHFWLCSKKLNCFWHKFIAPDVLIGEEFKEKMRKLYLKSGAEGQNHVKDITGCDAGNFDGRLVG